MGVVSTYTVHLFLMESLYSTLKVGKLSTNQENLHLVEKKPAKSLKCHIYTNYYVHVMKFYSGVNFTHQSLALHVWPFLRKSLINNFGTFLKNNFLEEWQFFRS
jgi:hypothetical protein